MKQRKQSEISGPQMTKARREEGGGAVTSTTTIMTTHIRSPQARTDRAGALIGGKDALASLGDEVGGRNELVAVVEAGSHGW